MTRGSGRSLRGGMRRYQIDRLSGVVSVALRCEITDEFRKIDDYLPGLLTDLRAVTSECSVGLCPGSRRSRRVQALEEPVGEFLVNRPAAIWKILIHGSREQLAQHRSHQWGPSQFRQASATRDRGGESRSRVAGIGKAECLEPRSGHCRDVLVCEPLKLVYRHMRSEQVQLPD